MHTEISNIALSLVTTFKSSRPGVCEQSASPTCDAVSPVEAEGGPHSTLQREPDNVVGIALGFCDLEMAERPEVGGACHD